MLMISSNKSSKKCIIKGQCPYPECGRVFRQFTHLKAHLRIHSGERPYVWADWIQCSSLFFYVQVD
jgi:hypothetical protein